MKKLTAIADAIVFLISVPFGAAGAALQYTACWQTKKSKPLEERAQKLKETERQASKLVSGNRAT